MDTELLLQRAEKNASRAIKWDAQGRKARAIMFYGRASKDLKAIIRNSDNKRLKKICTERADAYRGRIFALKLRIKFTR